MHTEHLNNVKPGRVAFGWFVSVAITSLVVIGLIAVGLLSRDGLGGTGWGLLAIAIGFFAGGWYVGMRAGRAPILHAVGMGLFSLLVWILANLFAGELLDADGWNVGGAYGASFILLQIIAAAIGGRIASRDARAGAVETS
jgi:hypothetical protein